MDKSIQICQAIESKTSSDILKPVASSLRIGLPSTKDGQGDGPISEKVHV